MTERSLPPAQQQPPALREHDGAEPCHNCGTPAPGRFCSACGQSTHVAMPSLAEFLHEFLTHHVAIDGTLLASLKRLLLSPGGLTLDFFIGKRARYVAPLRLYLTFNVIFFLVLQLMHVFGTGGGAEDAESKEALARLSATEASQALDQAAQEIAADRDFTPAQRQAASDKLASLRAFSATIPDTVSQGQASLGAVGASSVTDDVSPAEQRADQQQARREAIDAAKDAARDAASDLSADARPAKSGAKAGEATAFPGVSSSPEQGKARVVQLENQFIPAWLDRHAPVLRKRIDALSQLSLQENADHFTTNILHFLPYTLLLMLPVCALLLQLAFVGRGRRYTEHLVAALHGHTFLFIVLLPVLLPIEGWIVMMILFGALIHMVLALSRIYGSRGVGLFLRLGVLAVTYSTALMFATLGALFASVLA